MAGTGTIPALYAGSARLDRLPIGRWHRRLVALVGIGAFFSLYEIFLAGVLGATLATRWRLGATGAALVIGAPFIGMFAGAIVLGRMADLAGRRRVLLVNVAIYAAFSLASAAAPNLETLVVLRVLGGVGIGGELVLVDTYLAELLPRRARGRYMCLAYTLGTVAVPIVAVAGARYVADQELAFAGWRWLLVAGGIGALVLFALRRPIPESPRWLASVGRGAEADRIIAAAEEQAGDLPEPDEISPRPPAFMRQRAGMLSAFQALWSAGYYGFAMLAPLVLVSRGFSVVDSLGYAALSYAGYPIGAALALALVERHERRTLIIGSALGVALFGVVFGMAANTGLIVAAGFLLTMCGSILASGSHVYQAELFPTSVRGSATGLTYSVSRAMLALLPFVGSSLISGFGANPVFACSAAALVAVALMLSAIGPYTTGRSLEEI